MVAFRPAIVHQFSAILGYFDVKECHAFDLVLSESEFMVGCEKCNKEMKVQVCITGTPLLFSNLVEFIYSKVTTYRVKGLKTIYFLISQGIAPGQPRDMWCQYCHQKLKVIVETTRFLNLQPNELSGLQR